MADTTAPALTEARLQQECGNWLNKHHRYAYQLFWHTPNGEARDRITGARLKAMHAKAGVPDCFLACPQHDPAGQVLAHGLFIEFKTATGSLSAHQKTMMAALTQAGFRVEVVRTVEEFQALLTAYLA
ncbi:VRR-NUC domain-containing protein [Hymenobacter properus]|uniref:VRR-NUC domain-containing protein n=1 Tax=Hymenobacter properus TaxID=2791026 RepID=A0A931BGH5_9BACT|nr:VRR-NUC domain-containing protein [Hymenobacter properus]MBF9140827.1 VRR-NUC domain-containing protein [Hymenobacter properus]MBR7719636.1 VRR-NUC domain-containing protein [Microvirga sp. SRT04]